MKTTKTLLVGAAVIVAVATRINVRADDLATAAAKASALVNRPIAASPHALEEFPWLLRGASPPIAANRPEQSTQSYPDNPATAAAKASALVNRPVVASPHGLEEFSSVLHGSTPQVAAGQPVQAPKTYPDNLAAAAAKASALVKRPVVASPHGLEEFPELLRGSSPQVEPSQLAKTNGIQGAPTPTGRLRINPSTHRGDYP